MALQPTAANRQEPLDGLTLTLPPDFLEVVTERVAEKLAAQLAAARVDTPWLTREQAAAHLGVPASRLEKDKSVPLHRWHGRVLYDREELDDWMRQK